MMIPAIVSPAMLDEAIEPVAVDLAVVAAEQCPRANILTSIDHRGGRPW